MLFALSCFVFSGFMFSCCGCLVLEGLAVFCGCVGRLGFPAVRCFRKIVGITMCFGVEFFIFGIIIINGA